MSIILIVSAIRTAFLFCLLWIESAYLMQKFFDAPFFTFSKPRPIPHFPATVLDKIAEVVKAFPCLKFRVRLAFRHRPVYVCLSQMTSEVFCVCLRGGMNNTVLAGRICALVLLVNNVVLRWATQWRAGTLQFMNPTT